MVEEPRGRVLLVDDDPQLLLAYERLLIRAGYVVLTATNGQRALAQLAAGCDAIVSDIGMPEMDGLALLRAVRERDLDLPILLMTGQPDVASAAEAVRFGAFRYLAKPVDSEELLRETQRAVRLYEWAKLRRSAGQPGGAADPGDRAGLHAAFERALSGMWIAYQPIVAPREKSIFAHEALMRTAEETLPHPGAVLRAAERLGRCEDLGRRVRQLVAATLDATVDAPLLFVNLHVRDLDDPSLFAPDAPLTRHAENVVLEVTERAALEEVADVLGSVARLRALGYRVAIDDLGAGYAGLTSFAQLQPDIVKLDGTLVRHLNQQPIAQKLVRSMVALGKDLGIRVIAEGVETGAERDALLELGCDLMQGYLFSRPVKPFGAVAW